MSDQVTNDPGLASSILPCKLYMKKSARFEKRENAELI
jgi:hypothetical protein